MKAFPFWVSVALLGALCAPGFANDWANVSETISSLRSEISVLSSTVADDEGAHQARMRSLRAQQADLELQVRREKAQLGELTESLTDVTNGLTDDAFSSLLETRVLDAALELKQQIHLGLPYRSAERLASVDQVVSELESQKITPQKATVQLWGLMEDELRLGRENAVDRQTISIDGQERLVQVARLGLMAVYFYTETGEAGYAKQGSDGWTWVYFEGSQQVEQVRLLVDSLSKGIRTGRFEVPAVSVR